MNILQWVYTTSCWNIRHSRGWETFSYSQGLTDEEVSELENKCQLQGNLPEEYFPVYYTLTLSTGKKVICQHAFLGNSFYDGRRGATLSHALIIDSDCDWPHSPMSYMGSDVFWKDLPENIKKQALYYMDNEAEEIPPEHLPVLSEDALVTSEKYSPCSIQEKLNDSDFKLNVSLLIEEFYNLDKERRPLLFDSKPEEAGLYLAALSYLMPWEFERKNLATVYKTNGNLSQYNFFVCAGTRDGNTHVNLLASNRSTETHPIVKAAAKDLEQWHRFTSRWTEVSAEHIPSLVCLFNLLKSCDCENLTDERIGNVLKHPEFLSNMELWKKLALSVGRYQKMKLSPEIFMSLTKELLTRADDIFSICSTDEQVQWATIIKNILLHSADMTAHSCLKVSEACQICAIKSDFAQLWLKENQFEKAVGYCTSSETKFQLLHTSYLIAKSIEVQAPNWLDYNCVKESIAELGSDSTLWSRVIDTCEDIKEAGTFWLILNKQNPDNKQTEVWDSYLSRLSRSDRITMRQFLLNHDQTDLAVAEFLNYITKNRNYGEMLHSRSWFRNYPDFAEKTIEPALKILNGTEFNVKEGLFLMKLLSDCQDMERQSLILSCLLSGFPRHEPDKKTILLAQKLYDQCKTYGVDEKKISLQELFCNLDVLDDIPSEEVAKYLESCFLPLFKKSSPTHLEDATIQAVTPWLLKHLLSKPLTPEVHLNLFHKDWGWNRRELLRAYESYAESTTRNTPKNAMDGRGILFLSALMQLKDKELLNDLLEHTQELLALYAGKKTLVALENKLMNSSESLIKDNWQIIASYILKNKKSVLSKILCSIFKKPKQC